jgi:hypothetical protein
MDINVTICDQRCYPNTVQQKARELGDTFVLVAPNWTMSDICHAIRGVTARYRAHVLRIVGHGGPTQIQLGTGLVTGNATAFQSIRGMWVDPTRWEVHHSPRIDCHSCTAMATTGTAGSPTPRVIMQALSNATGVPVRGGEVNQRVDTLFNFSD